MDTLRVALVQMAAVWEKPMETLNALDSMISSISSKSVDLIVLPETFSTGFTNASKTFAETMDGPAVQWLKSKATTVDATIAGSLIVSENDNCYNRLIFAHPNGSLEYYDKHHLFTLSKEHEHFTAGQDRKVIELKGWRIFPQICYDLRFPVWARNNLNYDLMLYVANWPAPRKEAWRSLLVARAIENQAFVIGVNRVGQDGNGLEYQGNSVCTDYTGKRLIEMDALPGVEIIALDKKPMKIFRTKLAFLKDQDKFHFD